HGTYGQYQRPQRDMFMHHVHEQVHHYDLNENHIQGYVEALAKKDGQWQIQLNDNQIILTDCVILANGCTHKPYIPNIYQDADDVCHIFDKSFNTTMYGLSSHVIGSGISAA
ncbi:pyridine nucleotide-disulfide oxidoreductase, partial [Staphylococcus aureus]|nr:pyridine nucleotide-disulfide oxidoreductase [Staphylococcus aureus]